MALFADAAHGRAAAAAGRGAAGARRDRRSSTTWRTRRASPPAALQRQPGGGAGRGEPGGGTALAATLTALGRLAAAAEGSAAGFRLVTRGGQQPAPGRHVPAAAACFALGRVLANEHPGLKPRRIDLDPGLAPEAAARRLAAELLAEADARGRGDADPRGAAGAAAAARPAAGPAAGRPGRGCRSRQPGQLGSLHWAPAATLPAPGPGEVLLRIEAAGLNFRDLMWAQGLLPEEALLPGFAGPGLGMECAGVVEAVGEGVGLAARRPRLRRRAARRWRPMR